MQLLNINLAKNKKKILSLSSFFVLISLLGILYSSFNTSYKRPINLGMDFIGGNEIRIERICSNECKDVSPDLVIEKLRNFPDSKSFINNIKLQFQNDNKLISIRTPFLNVDDSNKL